MKKILGYFDVILFLVLVTLKSLIYGNVINEYFNIKGIIFPILASLIVIVSFSLLFKAKRRSKFLYIWNIILTIVLIADTNYFRYYKDVLSIPVIRNGLLLGSVNEAIKDVIKPQDLLLLLDIILIPIIKTIFKIKFKDNYLDYINNKAKTDSLKIRIPAFALLIALGISADSYYIHKLNIEQPRLIEGMYNKIYITNSLGNLNCHVLDVCNFAKKNILNSTSLDDNKKDDIQKYLLKNSKNTGTDFNNIGKGKNLIMLQVEALQGFVINKTIEGQEITPNLNRWIKKSLYFDNYYYQVAGGNTSDAEFMSNNSLYPAASGAAYYIYSGDEFSSLATKLKEKKYYSAALHGYKEGFWNRNAMYVKEGFDNFYGEKSFNLDETIGLGLSDQSFFKQSLEKMESFKKPYFSFLVTLTSHYPFEAVDKYGEFKVGKYENTFIGNYIKSIHYTDKQIGIFLDELEKNGTLDNSILVMYGDHFAIPKNHANELYSFVGETKDDDYAWAKYQKVPLIMHFPKDANKGLNSTVSGQMDLYPTLSNMFDLNNKYMFGQDIFNVKDRFLVFRTGSFIDNNVFYSSSTKKYYDLKTALEVAETKELKKKKDEALKQLDYSDTLLDHNLIKKYKEK
ncbi:LTA synthase family protein [Haloimpatiens sp. FM7315]|uniref:LTA synthase family protein n=1 Tax=Haloimpatiens sp. FM7315 TaxID=3298609 RepID=UPI00370A2F7C